MATYSKNSSLVCACVYNCTRSSGHISEYSGYLQHIGGGTEGPKGARGARGAREAKGAMAPSPQIFVTTPKLSRMQVYWNIVILYNYLPHPSRIEVYVVCNSYVAS